MSLFLRLLDRDRLVEPRLRRGGPLLRQFQRLNHPSRTQFDRRLRVALDHVGRVPFIAQRHLQRALVLLHTGERMGNLGDLVLTRGLDASVGDHHRRHFRVCTTEDFARVLALHLGQQAVALVEGLLADGHAARTGARPVAPTCLDCTMEKNRNSTRVRKDDSKQGPNEKEPYIKRMQTVLASHKEE